MPPFDPDAYLAGGAEKPFNPDAYLASSDQAPTTKGFDPDAYLSGTAPTPGLLDYGVETGKAVARGGIEAGIVAPLHGLGAMPTNPDFYPETAISNTFYEAMSGQKPRDIKEGIPVTSDPAYRLGTAISETTSKLLPDRDILHPVVRDIAAGFGSVGANLATMMVPGVKTIAPAAILLQGAGEAAERGVKAGATDEQIRRAGALGNVSGATEFADLLLTNLGSWGKVAGLMKQVGVNTLKGFLIEGGQEGLQQGIQNLIAKGIYKPDQSIMEDVGYNFVIGGIVGGTVGGAMTRREAPVSAPTPEAIAQSVAPPQAMPLMPAVGGPQVTAPDTGPVTGPVTVQPAVEQPLVPPTVVEPPPAPTVAEQQAKTLPADQVEFIQEQTEKFRPKPQSFEELLAPIPTKTSNAALRDEIATNPGINAEQITNVLSQQLYGEMSSTVPVAVKELFQNAFDAAKGLLEAQPGEVANIDVKMDPKTRTVTVQDDGTGMPSSVMANEFLTIGGTKKETKRPSGGFGVAKVQILLGAKNLRARSLRGGQYSELNTTGEQLKASINKKGPAPNLLVRPATEADRALFPKGHGTIVDVTLPENYVDPGTEETRSIPFDADSYYHDVLQKSPLFANVNATFNGRTLPIGANFPIKDYNQFANVKFGWGTARVYMSQKPGPTHSANGHVLSNGLWQFSQAVKRDPNNWQSENLPFTIYIDLDSKVPPGGIGYPLSANRQEFSPSTKKDFKQLLTYMSLLYHRVGLEEMASNFGEMQYLDYDADVKAVKAASSTTLTPKKAPAPNAFTLPKPSNSVRVEDGKIIVDGHEVPELTPEIMGKFRVTTDDLSISQDEIESDRVMLHDNTNIIVSPSETRSVVDYGREKFGRRFDEFTFAVGDMFKQLRNAVAKGMPKIEKPTDPFEQVPFGMKEESDYTDLPKGAVGISLDAKYHGVSITLPFKGIFVNPFVVTFGNDPAHAALSTVTTMIHEIAHHKPEYRHGHGHDVGWRHEMANIQIMLNTNNEFDFMKFQQRMVDIYASYQDVFNHMNGVWTSGDFRLQSRGKRFQDFGADEVSDGNISGNAGELGGPEPRGSSMAHWVVASETIPPAQPGRGGPANTLSSSGSHRPSDNGRARNYAALRGVDPGISAPPQQPEVNVLRDGIKASPVGGGSVPPVLKEAAAHADRFNWMYKYLAGITQLLDGNPYFQPLRKYVERARQMHSDESTIWDAAMRLQKEWRDLGAQMKNLEALILDVQDMPYLTPGERSMNLWRHPTTAEFSALVAKHKISNEALTVYNKMRQMDETFLRLQEEELIASATRRIPDPVKLAARIDQIEAYGRIARSQPFFPFTRFGRHYVIVKDQAGVVTHFETFEPSRVVGLTTKRAERYQQAQARQLEKRVPPGHTVVTGVLPETAEPFLGQNPLMIQQMLDDNVGLTDDQIAAIQLMQNIRNPAMGLKHRAVHGDRSIQGHSLDLPRSFAKYYFHGGRYYAKMRHLWALKIHVAEAGVVPGNKAGLIASYMRDHLANNILDAKGDFGFWKGAIFLWAMGYSVAAATTNLTQTPFVSYPFLAGKFGDFRATKHLIKSILDVTNFYKRGFYTEPSPTTSLDFEMKALGYGIKTGRVSETQAAELAGLAGGGKLISGMGGSVVEQGAAKFQEKAAWAFEMAEQFNRRIVFRAALRLAQENPTAKFVNESVQKYQGEYELLRKGSKTQDPFTEAEAKAIVTAIHSTDQTQFVYARHARSVLFRGKKNILFVFKQYIQSLLWMLGNNKADVLPRWIVIAMLFGGLGGVPGYDDLKGFIRAIGIWFFGKDVNLDRLIRDWALQWFNGTIPPDMVLHGLARRGFGLPALADMMGSFITGQTGRGLLDPKNPHSKNVPYPVLDRSRAIGVGNILPLDVGKLLTPTDKLEKTIAEETQRASGAVFSVGFNLYKAIMDNDSPATDFKRWEKTMPRALSSASRMYRAFSEGRERGSKGGPNSAATVVPYDVRDTEQMMEAIAMGLGYQPLRQQAKWDIVMAQAEASAFYDMRKKGLLEEYYEALKGRDPKEIEGVRDAIVKYNKELPDYAKANAISGDTVRKSMQTRERTVISRELGIPVQKSKIGISQEMQRLFPEATIDVRRVR